MLIKLKSFQVDAFSKKVFGGNPAVVVMLEEKLANDTLLQIAKENAVSETAFLLPEQGYYNLRWFTPDIEMDLCGHATLAAAHILFTEFDYSEDEIIFKTVSGNLKVERKEESYLMDFPQREAEKATLPIEVYDSLSIKPYEVYKARDYMLLYRKQEEIENIDIDRSIIDEINLDPGGVIITAPGKDCDFVSRFFTPQSTIFEDPVTGSAHCTLAPFWAAKTGKNTLYAKQLSKRGGSMHCILEEGRVILKGNAVTYSKGEIFIPYM